jgi:hypothetical protein
MHFAVSQIASLVMIMAAIVLFVRMRSVATGLFLFGSVIGPVLPLAGLIFERNQFGSAGEILSIGPICTAIGLFWYATTVQKAPTVQNATKGGS